MTLADAFAAQLFSLLLGWGWPMGWSVSIDSTAHREIGKKGRQSVCSHECRFVFFLIFFGAGFLFPCSSPTAAIDRLIFFLAIFSLVNDTAQVSSGFRPVSAWRWFLSLSLSVCGSGYFFSSAFMMMTV